MQQQCVFGSKLISFQRGNLKIFAIHLITLNNVLEYMLIVIRKTEAANFVKIYIYVILKTLPTGMYNI